LERVLAGGHDDSEAMIGFVLFAVVFIGLVTLAVRVTRLGVRGEVAHSRALLLTGAFVVLLLLAWWLSTRGEKPEDRLLAPLILPSPCGQGLRL